MFGCIFSFCSILSKSCACVARWGCYWWGCFLNLLSFCLFACFLKLQCIKFSGPPSKLTEPLYKEKSVSNGPSFTNCWEHLQGKIIIFRNCLLWCFCQRHTRPESTCYRGAIVCHGFIRFLILSFKLESAMQSGDKRKTWERLKVQFCYC